MFKIIDFSFLITVKNRNECSELSRASPSLRSSSSGYLWRLKGGKLHLYREAQASDAIINLLYNYIYCIVCYNINNKIKLLNDINRKMLHFSPKYFLHLN